MIKGVGVDIVKISRFNDVSEHFISRILTNEEKEEYLKRSNKTQYLASRFAVKEAYFKATQDIHYLNISVLNDENGMPYILDKKNIHLSISHEDEYVVAYLILSE